MTPQHEIDRFYWNCASGAVDVLRARLGIPEAVPFRSKVQTPLRTQRPALIDHSWFLACMYAVCAALLIADCARWV